MNRSTTDHDSAPRRRGFTMTELVLVLTILAILVSLSAPSFQFTIEQSKADMAVANLRGIWVAERAYWLDNRTFVSDLTVLQGLGLIDPSLVTQTSPYTYSVTTADGSNLLAVATRNDAAWQGSFMIDENGVITGLIQASGQVILPSSQ